MEDQIMEILREINDRIPDYKGEDFYEDGLLDSFQVVELVETLEDTWNIEIPPEMVVKENFVNKEAIINMMRALTA